MAKESPELIAYLRTIPACRDFVPWAMRFAIFVLLIIVYQFTGGIYMAAVTQISGSSAWLNEDIMMAGYASLIGMTMLFPVQFKVMFRFENRTVLVFSTIVLIIGTLICIYTDNLVVIVTTCYFCGLFKMAGTFFCISNIQLCISPTRDLAYFYPFLYTIILSCIQLSGIATGYSIWAWDWQTMHIIMVGVLVVALLVIHVTMRRNYRLGPYQPFKGVDYLGAILWSLFLLCVLFIGLYGEHYDWWQSDEIRIATIFTIITLILAIYHAKTTEHPFINLVTFTQPKFFYVSVLFVSYSVLSGTAGQIQNMFTEGILHFDMFHSISLNWGVVAGILCGTPFSFYVLARKKWRPRNLAIVGFCFFTVYQVMLYFLIDPETAFAQLWLPMWFRGVGNAILYIVLAYTLGKNVAFVYYFMALCAIGFIRTGVGTPVCQAVLAYLLTIFRNQSLMQLSMDLTGNSAMNLYGELQRQSMMVGIKDVYGIAAAVGIVTIICLCLSDFRGLFRKNRDRESKESLSPNA
ncbi:MAG: hypothetical protein HDS11_03735 [Bacteroides sp.]|nr:hypothetical protein [Bacteroides sp.]